MNEKDSRSGESGEYQSCGAVIPGIPVTPVDPRKFREDRVQYAWYLSLPSYITKRGVGG